jgi:hypothetical protein
VGHQLEGEVDGFQVVVVEEDFQVVVFLGEVALSEVVVQVEVGE